jgi:DNA replication protein DnaC
MKHFWCYFILINEIPTFAGEMKQAISNDKVGPKLDEVKRAPILMIDDIGADSMSAWIRDEVLGVIFLNNEHAP